MQTKICTKCNVEKTIDFFYVKSNGWFSSPKCKNCIRLEKKYALGYEKPIDLPNEIWKDIPNYEGVYKASNFCRIKSLERKSWNGSSYITQREIILKPFIDKKGYHNVSLYKNNKKTNIGIYVLTAMAFLNHVPCGFDVVVDHIDDDTSNNTLSNLQLLTNRQNVEKGFKKKNLSSKYTGVCFNKKEGNFKSVIYIKGAKYVYLGSFKEELDAHNAYQTALSNLDQYKNDKQFRELVKQLNQK